MKNRAGYRLEISGSVTNLMGNIASNFLFAVAKVLDTVLFLYMIVVIARAVISWVNPDPYNPIVRFLYAATEPVLYRIRKWLPFNLGMIDISPIIVFLIIIFLQQFVVSSLMELAVQMGQGPAIR